ncbi:hypothetical protein O7632_13135 [Solwaraspora sp. WMMD406]|uniref:hypothetical protein n=1 Tax=Solwaraspora sp. WMMD406 TaxID=3016095 RepID=UPI002416F1B8|nr:hypothetical protein [Solwaraspora sp. WMMD406]MDG4765035.1 hypothetical protein [Solwaraspora sp. WMMD406]
MESLLCFAVVVVPIAIIGWQLYETRQAVATTTVDSPYEPAQVAQIIRDAFGGPRAVLWTTTGGPGTINMRRRGVRGGITMSIDIEPLSGGGTRVDMWASGTVVYFGFLVNFAGVVNRRKRAIARRLTAELAAGHTA